MPPASRRLVQAHKLLVVDDAHDREGLKLLIEYAVDPGHRARLLIATRPYGSSAYATSLRFITSPILRLCDLIASKSKSLKSLSRKC